MHIIFLIIDSLVSTVNSCIIRFKFLMISYIHVKEYYKHLLHTKTLKFLTTDELCISFLTVKKNQKLKQKKHGFKNRILSLFFLS